MTGDIIVADIHMGWGSNNTLFEYSALKAFDSGVWRAPAVKPNIRLNGPECHITAEQRTKNSKDRLKYIVILISATAMCS